MCGDTATDVDHIDGTDDHRLANLQSLCRRHHMLKTRAEAERAKRRKHA